ncbi:MAG TPA: WG repeat-containing protein [Cyclobacteriaceae bacterium]|nr:WG repeat-containing protein [Cyclobacteriaceae bacterium]HMX88069.1 WG repeat-containing protein [Saprospiraceae bacterium]HMX00902.1 WG repeat-containing protein [Cyclobacteriaceae bacterium]HMY93706.1 WG repeat-containing protein [Cyclobacteriaceae bacterium]HNA12860.1 WG repeat-containing protein [Cyclobacteriaceae bacterium]
MNDLYSHKSLISRLEIIKNLISLKEYDSLQSHINKLKEFSVHRSITSIVLLLTNEEYFDADLLITQKLEALKKVSNQDVMQQTTVSESTEEGNIISNRPKLIPYRKGDKWGFCNLRKEIVIDCVYDKVAQFKDERARVCQNGLWGLIDENGNAITETEFDYIDAFSNGLACVRDKKYKFGFINQDGELVVPLIYDNVNSFSDGLAMVELNEKRGFIDTEGNVVIGIDIKYARTNYNQNWYKNSYFFREGLCLVETGQWKELELLIDGKSKVSGYHTNCSIGFINKNEEIIIPFRPFPGDYLHSFTSFSEGLHGIGRKTGKKVKHKIYDEETDKYLWGFIDKMGNEVIPCEFESVGSFSEGLAVVQKNEKFGFINRRGVLIIPCIYENAMPFSEGHAAVQKKVSDKTAMWGYIDKKGKTIIPFINSGYLLGSDDEQIPYCPPMKEGFIQIQKDEFKGFINRNNETVIKPKYYYASFEFENGLAYVNSNQDWYRKPGFYIDKNGEEYYED